MTVKSMTKTFTFALIILMAFLSFTLQARPAMAHCDVDVDYECDEDFCDSEGEPAVGETCNGGSCQREDPDAALICSDEVVRVDFDSECNAGENGRQCGPEDETNLGTCGRDPEGTERIICNRPAGETTDKDKDETPAALKPRLLANPLGTSSVAEIIARLISIITGVSGSIALLMFVYGGIQWLIAGGDPGKIEAGRKAMVWAVVGLIIIFGSYAILNFLFRTIGASSLL